MSSSAASTASRNWDLSCRHVRWIVTSGRVLSAFPQLDSISAHQQREGFFPGPPTSSRLGKVFRLVRKELWPRDVSRQQRVSWHSQKPVTVSVRPMIGHVGRYWREGSGMWDDVSSMAGGQGSSCGTLKGPGVGPTPAKAKWGPHNPRLGVEFPRSQGLISEPDHPTLGQNAAGPVP